MLLVEAEKKSPDERRRTRSARKNSEDGTGIVVRPVRNVSASVSVDVPM